MTIKKIAITTSSFAEFSQEPLERLRLSGYDWILNPYGRTMKPEETVKIIDRCYGVIAGTEMYDERVIAELQNLRVIVRVGSGLDTIDLALCKNRGIDVSNTADGPTRAVAELVIGLILNLLRKISVMDRQLRSGKWQKHMGGLFEEKIVGIIGFGRIGRAVAGLSHALGAKVIFYDPLISEKQRIPGYANSVSFENLVEKSDIVSLHLPYSLETRHLIDARVLEKMKRSALLVNCARGGLIDESALYEALGSQKIAGAALDVFSEEPYLGPLTGCENLILTPHIGSYAKEARVKMEMDAVTTLIKALENGK